MNQLLLTAEPIQNQKRLQISVVPVALSLFEEKYKQQLEKAYEDGVVIPEERAKLEGFREAAEISSERAKELEDQVAANFR